MAKPTKFNPGLGAPLLALLIAVVALAATPGPATAGAIVVNAQTGEILYADDADRGHYPASLTKMMTLYMTFDALAARTLSLTQALPVSKMMPPPPVRCPRRWGCCPARRSRLKTRFWPW